MSMQWRRKGGVVSHKVSKVKGVEWLLQALMGPSEMGAGERRNLTGFDRIPMAVMSRTLCP